MGPNDNQISMRHVMLTTRLNISYGYQRNQPRSGWRTFTDASEWRQNKESENCPAEEIVARNPRKSELYICIWHSRVRLRQYEGKKIVVPAGDLNARPISSKTSTLQRKMQF